MKSNVAGYYKIVATDKDTKEERILADWFPNLITNNGLNLLNTGSNSAFRYCYVGTGNTPPLPTDSTLQSFIGAVGNSTYTKSAQSTAPYYGKFTRSFTFNPGGAVGNLSEVGTGYDSQGTNLFSRALITDAQGNPITITVLPNDYLTVIYELRLYPPDGITTGTATIAGVETQVTVEAVEKTSASSWMPMDNDSHGSNICFMVGSTIYVYGTNGGSLGSISYAGTNVGAYTKDTFYRDGRINLTLAQGNSATGIGSILIYTWVGAYKVTFDPPIVKDNTRTLSLDYRVSWGRYTP